jgi:hypothetical protein
MKGYESQNEEAGEDHGGGQEAPDAAPAANLVAGGSRGPVAQGHRDAEEDVHEKHSAEGDLQERQYRNAVESMGVSVETVGSAKDERVAEQMNAEKTDGSEAGHGHYGFAPYGRGNKRGQER